MDKKKKYLIGIAVAGLAAFVSISLMRAWDVRDGYSVALGEYRALAATAKAGTARALSSVKAQERTIAGLDAAVQGLRRDVGKKELAIGKLTARQVTLEEALAGAVSDSERVAALTGLVETWKEKYAALYSIVADKDSQIAALEDKCLSVTRIAADYKTLWEDAVARADASERARKRLELNYRVAALGRRAGTIISVAALVAAAYSYWHFKKQ
jgi:hypothetical protein